MAEANTAMSSAPAAAARTRPRRLGTSTGKRVCSVKVRAASSGSSSSASASCGTHFGCTKPVASIIHSPASPSLSMNSALADVGTTAFSFCRPSRAPTS